MEAEAGNDAGIIRLKYGTERDMYMYDNNHYDRYDFLGLS